YVVRLVSSYSDRFRLRSPLVPYATLFRSDWMPWGDAAFERAKREDRPIFLVVGVSNSELSAAMNRQTFSNPDVAAFLNETYVCRSEEHTLNSSHVKTSYAVFCLKKKIHII